MDPRSGFCPATMTFRSLRPTFATSVTAPKLPRDLPTILLDSSEFRSFLSSPAAASGGEPGEVRQSHAAAILYSSGTTGRVKGAVLTHRNLIARTSQFVAPAAAATLMLTVPLFHAYGFVFCLKAVAAGDTAAIQTERFDVKRALAAVGRFRVTNLALAPPAPLAILWLYEEDEEEKMGEGGPYDLSPLRVVRVTCLVAFSIRISSL